MAVEEPGRPVSGPCSKAAGRDTTGKSASAHLRSESGAAGEKPGPGTSADTKQSCTSQSTPSLPFACNQGAPSKSGLSKGQRRRQAKARKKAEGQVFVQQKAAEAALAKLTETDSSALAAVVRDVAAAAVALAQKTIKPAPQHGDTRTPERALQPPHKTTRNQRLSTGWRDQSPSFHEERSRSYLVPKVESSPAAGQKTSVTKLQLRKRPLIADHSCGSSPPVIRPQQRKRSLIPGHHGTSPNIVEAFKRLERNDSLTDSESDIWLSSDDSDDIEVVKVMISKRNKTARIVKEEGSSGLYSGREPGQEKADKPAKAPLLETPPSYPDSSDMNRSQRTPWVRDGSRPIRSYHGDEIHYNFGPRAQQLRNFPPPKGQHLGSQAGSGWYRGGHRDGSKGGQGYQQNKGRDLVARNWDHCQTRPDTVQTSQPRPGLVFTARNHQERDWDHDRQAGQVHSNWRRRSPSQGHNTYRERPVGFNPYSRASHGQISSRYRWNSRHEVPFRPEWNHSRPESPPAHRGRASGRPYWSIDSDRNAAWRHHSHNWSSGDEWEPAYPRDPDRTRSLSSISSSSEGLDSLSSDLTDVSSASPVTVPKKKHGDSHHSSPTMKVPSHICKVKEEPVDRKEGQSTHQSASDMKPTLDLCGAVEETSAFKEQPLKTVAKQHSSKTSLKPPSTAGKQSSTTATLPSSAAKPNDETCLDAKPVVNDAQMQPESSLPRSSRSAGTASSQVYLNVPSKSSVTASQKPCFITTSSSLSTDQGGPGLKLPEVVASTRRLLPQPRTATSSPVKRDTSQRMVKWVRKSSDSGAIISTLAGESHPASTLVSSSVQMPARTSSALTELPLFDGGPIMQELAPVMGKSRQSTSSPEGDLALADSALCHGNETAQEPGPGSDQSKEQAETKGAGTFPMAAKTRTAVTAATKTKVSASEGTPTQSTEPDLLTIPSSTVTQLQSPVQKSPHLEQKMQGSSDVSETVPGKREERGAVSFGRDNLKAMRNKMQLLAQKSPLLQEKMRQRVVTLAEVTTAGGTGAETGDSGSGIADGSGGPTSQSGGPDFAALHAPSSGGAPAREATGAALLTEGDCVTVDPMPGKPPSESPPVGDTCELEKQDPVEVAAPTKEKPELKTTRMGELSVKLSAAAMGSITGDRQTSSMGRETSGVAHEVMADGLKPSSIGGQESVSQSMLSQQEDLGSQSKTSEAEAGNVAEESIERVVISDSNTDTSIISDTEEGVVARFGRPERKNSSTSSILDDTLLDYSDFGIESSDSEGDLEHVDYGQKQNTGAKRSSRKQRTETAVNGSDHDLHADDDEDYAPSVAGQVSFPESFVPKPQFSIDSLVQERRAQKEEQEELHQIKLELEQGIRLGGLAHLVKTIEDEQRESSDMLPEHEQQLRRLDVMQCAIQDCHPGEEAFDSARYQCLFSYPGTLTLAACGFTPGSGYMDRYLSSAEAGSELLIEFLTSDVVQLCFETTASPDALLSWAFYLMSVHHNDIQVYRMHHLLYDMLHKHTGKAACWVPTVKHMARVFLNYGAKFEDICPAPYVAFTEADLRFGAVSRPEEEAMDLGQAQDARSYNTANLQYVIRTLTVAVTERYDKYSGDDLVALIVMLMKVALDKPLNVGVLKIDFEVCLAALLNAFTAADWANEIQELCVLLPRCAGSHHHNMLHLTQLMPCVERGRYLQRHLAYTFLNQLTGLMVMPEHLYNFKVEDLCQVVSRFKLSHDCDFYLVSSLISLLDCAVGSETLHAFKRAGLTRLMETLRHRISEVKEYVSALDRTMVKDMMVRLTSKWSFMLQNMGTKQKSLFAFTRKMDKGLTVEEVAGSQETDSDGEPSDQASLSDPLENLAAP